MRLPIVRVSALLWLLLLGALIPFAFSGLPVSAQQSPAITIQSQITAAAPGATINIPPGIYNESLTVNKSITLTGVSSATTIIQALPGQRVITATTGDLHLINFTIRGGSAITDVGGGVKFLGANLHIESCTVANNAAVYGGGIFQDTLGRLDIVNSRVESNGATLIGGGIYAKGSPSLLETVVISNTAAQHGGGLHSQNNFTSLSGGLFGNNRAGTNGGAVNANNGIGITATQFVSNTADLQGGGVLQYNSGFPVSVSGAVFERNGAGLEGGGLYARGNVTVTGSAFVSNTVDSQSSASTSGGGIHANGGAVWLESSTLRGNSVACDSCPSTNGGGLSVVASPAATIRNTVFEMNNGWFGGAVYSSSPHLTVLGSTFRSNSGGYGGGISASQADIRGSTFSFNSVINNGGALSSGGAITIATSTFAGNAAVIGAGGALWSGGNLDVLNSAFTSNRSNRDGQAMFLEHDVVRTLRQVTISHVGWNNGPAVKITGGTLAITNAIVASYTVGISQTGGSVAVNGLLWDTGAVFQAGTGAFTLSGAYGAKPFFTSDSYHLTSISQAIDHGVNSGVLSDLDGNPRPWGAGYDLGAVEYPRYRAYLPLMLRQ